MNDHADIIRGTGATQRRWRPRDEAWIKHLAEHGYVVVGDVVSRAAVQSAAEVLCTRALCDAFISPDLYSP